MAFGGCQPVLLECNPAGTGMSGKDERTAVLLNPYGSSSVPDPIEPRRARTRVVRRMARISMANSQARVIKSHAGGLVGTGKATLFSDVGATRYNG